VGGTGSIGQDGGGGGVRAGGTRLNGWVMGGQAGHVGPGKRCGVSRSGGRGVRGHGGEGAWGTPGSVGRLDCWVQVMDLWSHPR
jgi:hypothetical protein